MVSVICYFLGGITGILVGVIIIFTIMGKPMRDTFFGINIEKKPIIIEWMDGYDQDVHVNMRGALVFAGRIQHITMSAGMNVARSLQMEIVDKAEVMSRVFRG